MSDAARESAVALPAPSLEALDRALLVVIGAAFLILFLAPSRIFVVPFPYDGEWTMYTPPNVIDLLFLGIGLALFARAGALPTAQILVLGLLLVVGALGMAWNGEIDTYHVADLVLFNLRVAGGLAVGALLWRAGLSGDRVALMFLAGAVALAVSAVPLALGFVSYEFYSGMGRFGSLGLAPNETAMVLAGAFNMLPWLTRERRWLGVAAPLLAFGVVLTGSRTGAILVALGFLWWLPNLVRLARANRQLAGWLVTALAVGITVWLAAGFIQRLLTQGAVSAISQRAAETGADESSSFRLTIYFETLGYLWENPGVLLAGVGGSNVGVEWVLSHVLPLGTYHSHDLALQALTAYGVLGVVGLTMLLWPLVRRPSRFPDLGSQALRAFVLSLLAGQVIQYGLWEEKFLLMFTVGLGFVAAASAARTGPATGGVSLGASP